MTIHKATPIHRIHRAPRVPTELAEREATPEPAVAARSPRPRHSPPDEATVAWGLPGPARGLSLGDYVELPFVHWRIIAGWLLLSIVAGLLSLIVWPRSYESEAKLMITVGRESVGLDPTATTSPTLMLQKTQEEEINSALEILASRQVAELVVDRLQIAPILEGRLPTAGQAAASAPSGIVAQVKQAISAARNMVDQSLLKVGIKDPIGDREQAVRKVLQSVSIYAPKRSTAITIHAEAKTPEMAQALAAAATSSFLDRHQSVNFNAGSRDFFQQQTQAVEVQLNQALAERAEFMQSSKVVSTEDQRRMLTDQMGAAQRDVMVTRGELEQALAEIEDLIQKAGTTTAEIVATKEEKIDETWSGMRQRVYELEIQEQSFASMYSADNPKLLSARQQLAGARQILQDLDRDRTNRMLTPNPVKLRLEEDLQRQQTKLVGLKSMLLEKEKQREELSRQVDELLEFELKLKSMDRTIAVLETSLGTLKSKLEEARVIDALQAEHISNVNIYQPATLVERPVSPKKTVVMAAFPLLGLMVGVGLALLREFGNKTLRSPRQVEQCLGRPVLVSIPYQSKLKHPTAASDAAGSPLPAAACHAILAEISVATTAEQHARGRVIGVLGVDPHCGASTLASSLSQISSRELGLSTLLVKANSLAASQPATAGSGKQPNAQTEDGGWMTERLQVIDISDDQHRHLLRFDVGGHCPLLREYQADHDLIVIDLPPASRPDCFQLIAQQLDYVLLVVESEKTLAPVALRLVRRLQGSGVAVGVVLNKTRHRLPQILSGFTA